MFVMKILSVNNSIFLKSSKTKLNSPGFSYSKNPCGRHKILFLLFFNLVNNLEKSEKFSGLKWSKIIISKNLSAKFLNFGSKSMLTFLKNKFRKKKKIICSYAFFII